MTKKGVSHQIGFVKGAVIIASLVASLLGARLAAIADVQAGRVTSAEVVTVDQNGMISPNAMQPVARSQSSR